jgi:hypothetical protein
MSTGISIWQSALPLGYCECMACQFWQAANLPLFRQRIEAQAGGIVRFEMLGR